MLIVFNKTDLLTQEELDNRLNSFDLPIPYVAVNTLSKDGLSNLSNYLGARKA